MTLRVYTPAEAAEVMITDRRIIDAACASGALVAVDITPTKQMRHWRILEEDLIDWHRRGRPAVP